MCKEQALLLVLVNKKLMIFFPLFQDLLNFDDPLNIEAAAHYSRDKESFRRRVKEYIEQNEKR